MAPNNNDEWLRNQLNNIEKKVDRLDQRADNIDVTLAKQSVELTNHIKRTELAEENIIIIRQEMKPIQTHVDQVHGVLKVIGLISLVIGIITGALELFKFFMSV